MTEPHWRRRLRLKPPAIVVAESMAPAVMFETYAQRALRQIAASSEFPKPKAAPPPLPPPKPHSELVE
eukprot:SAG11_NODE_33415_length_277_cov_1.061798_1_plen_67_part_10